MINPIFISKRPYATRGVIYTQLLAMDRFAPYSSANTAPFICNERCSIHICLSCTSRERLLLAPKGYHMLGWFRNTIFKAAISLQMKN